MLCVEAAECSSFGRNLRFSENCIEDKRSFELIYGTIRNI